MYSLTPVLSCSKQSYETITKELKEKICCVLGKKDSYTGIFNAQVSAHIPDHKFPEERWDESTPVSNPCDMTQAEIQNKFQLLSPQANMQKRIFCKRCISSKKRGYPFGIKYYYSGSEDWDETIPEKGKDAEKGCFGCGWYDLEEWRKHLNDFIKKPSSKD